MNIMYVNYITIILKIMVEYILTRMRGGVIFLTIISFNKYIKQYWIILFSLFK